MLFRLSLLVAAILLAGCGDATQKIDLTNNSNEALNNCNLRLTGALIPFGTIGSQRGLVQEAPKLEPKSKASIEWTDSKGLEHSESLDLPIIAGNAGRSDVLSIVRTTNGSFRVSWQNGNAKETTR